MNNYEVIPIKKKLYKQLSDALVDKIHNKEYLVGDYLPSERKLVDLYDVSRTTVRLALDDLERKGYISRQHGKGSFVVDYYKTVVNLGEMYSFTEEMKNMGKKPKTTLLDYLIITDDERLMELFKKQTSTFIKLIRLRSADDIPMMYEETYIPYDKFKSITEDDLNKRALYDIFKEDYNEIVKLAQEEFNAGLATKKVAEILDLRAHSSVLEIYRTTINQKNELIEYTESKARPDKFSYRTVHYNTYLN